MYVYLDFEQNNKEALKRDRNSKHTIGAIYVYENTIVTIFLHDYHDTFSPFHIVYISICSSDHNCGFQKRFCPDGHSCFCLSQLNYETAVHFSDMNLFLRK